MSVVTRFAPSPTGLFHAGSYRTALFAYIFARKSKGKFILRIEDTDKERSKKEYEENIIDSLKWLGLTYDEFFRQSDRGDIYSRYIKQLIDAGHAYVSKEDLSTKKDMSDEDRAKLRSEVIRFKNPCKKVKWHDLVRGDIEFDTTELGDFVIAKDMNEPVFHLVNVIDDFEMGMTHVIRGEDHISNTPRQILIYEAIGAKVPEFAHIPLLLAPDRSKLSKRHGALAMTEYRAKGYLPEALVNYMALLGWHPEGDEELMNLDEIIEKFSLERVQKGGAIFDVTKLNWFNKQYITKLSDEDFIKRSKFFIPEWLIVNSAMMKKLTPILKSKVTMLSEIETMLSREGELAFLKEAKEYSADMLLWKKNPDKELSKMRLGSVVEILNGLDEDKLDPESVKTAIWPLTESDGRGEVLWPMRMALTGQDKSPDPFVCVTILGKDESLKRLNDAINKLS